jgi:hypothetical protein
MTLVDPKTSMLKNSLMISKPDEVPSKDAHNMHNVHFTI